MQGQGQGGVPQNPTPALGEGAGAGGVPINPFNFRDASVESFVPASRIDANVTNEYHKYLPLARAICRGDLQDVRRFLNQRPDAINAWINDYDTPLIIACYCGRPEIVKELLLRMTPEQTETPRRADGPNPYHTPLTVAAENGNMDIAEALLAKNPKLIELPGYDYFIPVTRAVWSAQEEMARYLYRLTPYQLFSIHDGYHGILLLLNAIFYGMLDIALDLFTIYPGLAVTKHPRIQTVPVECLASRADLFQSGCNLGYWQSLIYSLVKSPTDPEASSSNQDESLLWMILQRLPSWFGINDMCRLKEKHVKAHKLLQGICEEVSKMDSNERKLNKLTSAFFYAVKFGNKEFLVEIIKTNPEFLWLRQDQDRRNIFHLAVQFRQEKIFSLFYGLDERRKKLICEADSLRHGVSHIAGLLSPPEKLALVAGAGLQLQRELQWFEEVKRNLPELHQARLNYDNSRPRAVFEESHKNLREEAEKWMKKNATSCTVVATLIATVTFAAIFTIPGGTQPDKGDPLHLRNTFMVSDLMSFFTSCTSVLVFLGILTSNYSFDEFLVSLPTKMIAGLSLLFISIAAMLVAFSTALFTAVYRASWVVTPVIVVTFCPPLLFVLLQYSILEKLISSTYGKRLFDREMENWIV